MCVLYIRIIHQVENSGEIPEENPDNSSSKNSGEIPEENQDDESKQN